MVPPLVPLHLGALHPVEQALTFLLAFGPFVVLGIVVVLRRRADDAEEGQDPGDPGDPDHLAGAADPGPQRER